VRLRESVPVEQRDVVGRESRGRECERERDESSRTVGAMLDADRLGAFAVTAFALIVIPGPSVLFVVSRGVALGRRAALATVAGNGVGVYLQVLLVAAGLGSLLERSVLLFEVVRLAGAAYLVYLGVQAFRHRRALATVLDVGAQPRSLRRILREGFLVGVSNPKTALFFAAVLPQFVNPDLARVPLQMALLGLIFVAIALASDSVWAMAAGTARAWLGRSPDRLAVLGGLGGVITIGLGIRLALTGRKD
jgi:threonine/homoserine/homoserine lactone efflux protein